MKNEFLLVLSLILCFGTVVLLVKLLKKQGLFMWTVFATITANIEVLIVVNAFGMEQTLGNVMFASSFLVTDIISECYGKKEANKAVFVGCLTSVFFIIFSQLWLCFTPAPSDWAMPSIRSIFSNTPQVMVAGLAAYCISQFFDVWLYHKWWNITEKKTGNKKGFLWLRNNGSTLVSQFINTVIFSFGAFWNLHEFKTLIAITISSYVIYIFTSLADTPFLYIARKIIEKDSGKSDLN